MASSARRLHDRRSARRGGRRPGGPGAPLGLGRDPSGAAELGLERRRRRPSPCLQPGQPGPGVVGVGVSTSARVAAVLVAQVGAGRRRRRLHLGQPAGSSSQVSTTAPQVAGHVGELGRRRPQPSGHRRRRGRPASRSGAPDGQVAGGRPVAGRPRRRAGAEGRRGRLAVGRQVGQTLLLGGEGLLLVGVRDAGAASISCDLVSAACRSPGPAAAASPPSAPSRSSSARQGPRRASASAVEVDVGEGVEGAALGRRVEQRLLLVLAVDVDQAAPARPGRPPGPSGRRPRPASARPPGLIRASTSLALASVAPRSVEPGLDQSPRRRRPAPGRARPGRPSTSCEGLDHQGLAGAGLPGQRGHARPELERSGPR